MRIHEALPFRREPGKQSSARKTPQGRRAVMKEWGRQARGKGEGQEQSVVLPKYRRIKGV